MHGKYQKSCYAPFHGHRYTGRRFLTKEEKDEMLKQHTEKKIEWLGRYKESLEKELTGVKERLEELETEKEE
jgi:hypothetical protein